MKRRLLQTLITCVVMSSLIVVPVCASPTEDKETLEAKKSEAEAQAASVNEELVSLLVDFNALKQDMATQEDRIAQAETDLAKAKEEEEKQYEDMKLRIKYMYENGDASFAEAILTATSYSDLVNKSEYVEKVHGYDRNKLMEYVQTKEEEAKLDDAIDILIGNNQKAELVGRLDEYFAKTERATSKQEEKVEAVVDINHIHQDFEELGLKQTAEHTRAFVKVQDGCNQFCSYCIIPYARGRVRSRGIESVLKEIRGLAEKGYQEVVLTGIHLSSYGVDCDNNLLHLIQEVHKIDGIRRIRLGSLEPKIVTEEFAGELAK